MCIGAACGRYFVVLSVEPVERNRVCVSCWYGEINRGKV